ncbi:MAG: tRNA 2-selenouridine(34) synthase MnmH [Myxococcales bacterium]|nr:tRNA 2-selenouridine(34) synthase MnmH [Myxococcales bacterium]
MRPIQVWNHYQFEPFDEIIDVRSPAEFREDHIPHAINLPVMNDEEREKIGILYKKHSTFQARRDGAAICSRRISEMLETHFATKPSSYKPLLYCWRGGMRSSSLGTVLNAVGWDTHILQGGYKGFRAEVRRALEQDFAEAPFVMLSGLTGSGKTRLLHALAQEGAQILDLEQLAQHRGSLLGAYWWEDKGLRQPSQKFFETQLWEILQKADPKRPLWVESESNKIGRVQLPKPLWDALCKAPRIEVSCPLEVRVTLLLQEYKHLLQRPEALQMLLEKMKPLHGAACVDGWLSLLQQHRWDELAASLLTEHYDPAYHRSSVRLFQETPSTEVQLASLDPQALQQTAKDLQGWARQQVASL